MKADLLEGKRLARQHSRQELQFVSHVYRSILSTDREVRVYLTGQSLLAILVAGLIAGWLAGKVVAGGGFGVIGDIAIGIVGALIGAWLLPHVGVHIQRGFVGTVIVAFIGAVVLLLVIRLLTGGFRRRGWGWRRRW